MSELTMSALLDNAFHAGRRDPLPGERIVYDDGYTRLFVTDPPELLASIERSKARALADPRAWADVLSDFAVDQALRAEDGKLTHACFDMLAAGDLAEFGTMLAKTLQPKIEERAEDIARDDWDESMAQP